MLDSLSFWLHETPLGEALLTMFISMLPVVELRGGLPAGGQEQREGQRGSEAALKMFFHMEFSFPMFAAQSAAIWMVT